MDLPIVSLGGHSLLLLGRLLLGRLLLGRLLELYFLIEFPLELLSQLSIFRCIGENSAKKLERGKIRINSIRSW